MHNSVNRLCMAVLCGAIVIVSGCTGSSPVQPEVISITAKRFEFNPSVVQLKLGVPVMLELTSLDRLHGFSVPELGIRVDVEAGGVARVSVTPEATGEYVFLCDIFCGGGHSEMQGRIVVTE